MPAKSRSPVADECGASLTQFWTKAPQDFDKEQQKESRERTFVRSSQASSPRRLGHTLILHRLNLLIALPFITFTLIFAFPQQRRQEGITGDTPQNCQ